MTGSTVTDATSHLRVVVGGLPELLLQMVVELLQREADIVVTAVVRDTVDLLVAAKDAPDLAVIGSTQQEPLPGIISHLLTEFPALRVVILTPENDEVIACWMSLQQKRLRVESGQQLMGIVRWLGQVDALAERK